VRAYYADNRGGVLASVYLDTLGMTCLLAFAAGFGGLVARRGGDPWGILGRLMVAGALGSLAITSVENLAEAALAFRAASVGEAATVEALFDLLLMIPLAVLPLAALMIAASAGIARSAIVPRWLGWAVLLPALLSLVGAAGLGDPRGPLAAIGLFGGFFPFLLWTLAVSVVLLVRRETDAPATEGQPLPLGVGRRQAGA
jgi:hypothetical protein